MRMRSQLYYVNYQFAKISLKRNGGLGHVGSLNGDYAGPASIERLWTVHSDHSEGFGFRETYQKESKICKWTCSSEVPTVNTRARTFSSEVGTALFRLRTDTKSSFFRFIKSLWLIRWRQAFQINVCFSEVRFCTTSTKEIENGLLWLSLNVINVVSVDTCKIFSWNQVLLNESLYSL